MESTCVRQSDLPHTSRLFTDFVYHFDRLNGFYGGHHADPQAWTLAASQVRYPDERRAALVKLLREQNGSSAGLDTLARPGAVAVVTGQQVGLFSGPCYTIYKALTASRLARRLTAEGIPAVPVFWLATEDHDFAEVNHCSVFGADHQPRLLEVESTGHDHAPVGGIAPERYPLEALRAALETLPHGGEVCALVEECYTPGETLGAAFASLLKRLLAPYGVLFLDPMRPGVRSLAAPLIRQAVEAAPALTAGLLERNRELEAAGYHAQVHVEPQTSLFFLLEGGHRITLRREGQHYVSADRRLEAAELAARAGEISPNALLRPVVQDYLLPTVCYVGGPAELAYLAQSEVLYRSLLGRMPLAAPRSGFTLLDEPSARLLKRYHLSPLSLFQPPEILREEISRTLVPAEVGESLRETTAAAGELLESLHRRLDGFDVTLAAALGKSREKILHQFAKIERKVALESLRRDRRAASDAASLSGLIYPDRHLQERRYTILPFLARHGLDLVERLHAGVRLDCPEHIFLTL